MLRPVIYAAVAGLFAFAGSASAQNYPNRPITMIIPFAAGGPTDVLGRIVGARMSEVLGQQVVIENVGGAGGMTGSKRVVDAKPDGYTIGIGTVGTHAQGQTLYKRPLYNSQTDFQPVALLAQVPILLTVRKDLPAQDLKEFLVYAKANQGKMQFGSAGAGSATHLGCVLLNYLMGTNIVHVPFKGTGPAMAELQAGRIDFMCEISSTAKAHVDAGSIRALTIMNQTRSPALPNLATSTEQGMKELVAYTWNGIFAPKGLPKDVLDRLNKAAVDSINSPAVKDKLAGLGAEIATGNQTTPEYLAKLVKDETEKWAVPIKASGVSVE
ncbi:MAG: tripartite tricarboxylate transporter substrate-binding protein [Xanthobacteraceae bacterium]|jgi:tripartite-type tricarboxylate transporter receptor subunit TctC